MEYIHVAAKLITGFTLLFLLVHTVGKKIIGQITPFHFISAIVLSELVGNATYNKEVSLFYIPFAVLLWGAILYALETISMKLPSFRRTVEGEPSMVIENGQIHFETLKDCRMNLSQLQSLLRQSETFSIREVAYCFIEPNGSLSILKKTPYQKPVQQDLNMTPKTVELPIALIRDGEVIEKNLLQIGKDSNWLQRQILNQGIEQSTDIVFADWAENRMYIIKRDGIPC